MKNSFKYGWYEVLSKIMPKQFYRVSVKALIWDETKTKFLLLQESDGLWEVPGGGLDWGEKPETGIARELLEETGLHVVSVSKSPICFTTMMHHRFSGWYANAVYEVQVSNVHDIKLSDECVEIDWVTAHDASTRKPAYNSVGALGDALILLGYT